METRVQPVTFVPGRTDTPFLIALPHSGAHYPAQLRAASCLSALTLRRSEDAFLDELLSFAPAQGYSMISTPFARAYVDVNRNPAEQDPLVSGEAIAPHLVGERASAGLGVVPRIVGSGLEIYARPPGQAVVAQRIAEVHSPYHRCLQQAIDARLERHGGVILLDCHSMPSGRMHGRPLAQVVLGDRHGRSCAPPVTALAQQLFEAARLRVARNDPYAGGYTTEFYGTPHRNIHVLQIEIDRSLYMDEARITPHEGLLTLRAQLATVFQQLQSALNLQRLHIPHVAPALAAE